MQIVEGTVNALIIGETAKRKKHRGETAEALTMLVKNVLDTIATEIIKIEESAKNTREGNSEGLLPRGKTARPCLHSGRLKIQNRGDC